MNSIAGITPTKIRTFAPLVTEWWTKWWPAAITFVVALFTIAHFYTFVYNVTDSLPQTFFVVLKQDRDVGRGAFAAFPWENDRPYPRGLSFIKQVAGVPGDVVTMNADREFFITTMPRSSDMLPGSRASTAPTTISVGKAKTHGSVGNMAGVPLEPGFTGVIPEGYLFMRAWSKDSLDSRYALLGLVPKDKVIGRAIPIF